MSTEGLKNELRLKIDECNRLHEELSIRPLKVVASCETVDTENHPKLTNEISEAIKSKKRFWCKVRAKGERFWVMPIMEDEQIFTGLVDNDVLSDINFNDLVEFQSSDVFEVKY